ncbi:group I intron endonuclease [Moumouvirus australiensis]|uniref:Group I intron endonuclease n=1 Tax=Moumouvirus australiensis TaxID=2109587 RepID=A0A2P1ELE4_9VIRU|nr:group I intron endonuclease [Moumouvirus australiensis]AVL94697.1 group I intron endonuclease [Moumouvirus australiensis]
MEKIILLNDIIPDVDKDINGDMYDQENNDTGVIYKIYNVYTGKSYIGKAYSYVGHGKKKPLKYGARGRFKRHWSNKDSPLACNECPVFYEALRSSELEDWFIFTLKVCNKKYLANWEKKLIEKENTSNPKYGYNYFVGNKKPDNEIHLENYQLSKAISNVKRAENGALRKSDKTSVLPANIYYRTSKSPNGSIREGYFVQIKLNGKLYNKAFLSMSESMESKMNKAKKQLQIFKNEASKTKNSGSKRSGNKAEKQN